MTQSVVIFSESVREVNTFSAVITVGGYVSPAMLDVRLYILHTQATESFIKTYTNGAHTPHV